MQNKGVFWGIQWQYNQGGKERMRYGLALAGGGTRGAAHVGVLMALEEGGLAPSSIAGTSIGAIVAGLYASDVLPREMGEMIGELSRHGKRLIDLNFSGLAKGAGQFVIRRPVTFSGLVKGDRLARFLEEKTRGMLLRQSRLPVLMPAVDIKTGRTVCFVSDKSGLPPIQGVEWADDVALFQAMRASSAVPAVFTPAVIGGRRFVDGGVTDNLPVDLLMRTFAPNVLAVDIAAEYEGDDTQNLFEIASHSLTIMSARLRSSTKRGERLCIRPCLPEQSGLLTFAYMEQCMQAGYEAARAMLPLIRQMFDDRRKNG